MNYKLARIIKYIPRLVRKTYLCWRFPFLKYYNDRFFYENCYWEMIEDGWRKAFGLQMCRELRAAARRDGILKQFRFSDVKQKYGYLDIHSYGGNDETFDILLKYEYISFRTCIHCGRRAKYVTSGWILPYCEDCLPEESLGQKEYYKDYEWYGFKQSDDTDRICEEEL